VNRDGRNRVFLNDQPTTLRLLNELAPCLLTIHGQREELGLAEPERQRELLDRSGGQEATEILARVERAYAVYREAAGRLERLTGDERARQERIDLLRFQLSEIDAAAPEEGEETELRREREVLRHGEAILRALGTAQDAVSEGEAAATASIQRAQEALEKISGWDDRAGEWAGRLEEHRIGIEEVAVEVGRRLGDLDLDPGRLDAVESRLAVLERLLRRFGDSTREVLRRRVEIVGELGELELDEAGRELLEREVEVALAAYRTEAEALSAARRRWADALLARLHEELGDLALAKARLGVVLETRAREGSPLVVGGEPVELGPRGFDQVVFTFAPNPGEPPRPLARIASGGELARVYLALQLAVRGDGSATTSTLVFDEVDVGIGGREAAAVGRKLRRLAVGGQILVVTHLPQVASQAHRHFRIRKDVAGERTFVSVECLEEEGRVEEVARMLAGSEITDLSRSHARELIAGGADA
jgi:DNA repair protein RecN (Recombination protein N)